ncbi:MAG TPA: hypothetical protein VH518_23395 [Tepidisphaeraceae bacterium]|jgi:plasmid stability protein
MKTTLDLPEDLVRRLKLRALREKRRLKDCVADVLRAGLAAKSAALKPPAILSKDRKTGLPLICCRRSAPRGQELTPQRLAEILAQDHVIA